LFFMMLCGLGMGKVLNCALKIDLVGPKGARKEIAMIKVLSHF